LRSKIERNQPLLSPGGGTAISSIEVFARPPGLWLEVLIERLMRGADGGVTQAGRQPGRGTLRPVAGLVSRRVPKAGIDSARGKRHHETKRQG